MAPAKAFGEQNPTQGETAVSWQTWSDGSAGVPDVQGDADWGKMELDLSGEEGRSAVYDLGSTATRKFTLTENRYGTGQNDAVLQYRTDTSSFAQDDASPAWIDYIIPFSVNCRYVQIREITSGDLIPLDRKIDWTDGGIPGGITDRETIYATIDAETYGDGVTDATDVIQTAITNCPENQVVYIPTGTYKVTYLAIGPGDSNITIRGDGPGLTILKKPSGTIDKMIEFAGYYDLGSYYTVVEAVKGSQVITLDSVAGLSVGDVLLITIYEDGTLVDSYGYNGRCTFCGIASGMRSAGQLVEITGIDGYDVSINLPLHWTYNPANSAKVNRMTSASWVTSVGFEDLTVTQDISDLENLASRLVSFVITRKCWTKNVEIYNIQDYGLEFAWALQNEFCQCYIHTAVTGLGAGSGYGFMATQFASNNLLYDNILDDVSSGGIELHGGASGNVISYNYIADILYSSPTYLIASPLVSHGAHPKMNLWEGNIGFMHSSDFIWGSSSHNTIFRSRSKGWKTGTTSNNVAVQLCKKSLYYNIVGNILGTDGQSNRYELLPDQEYDGEYLIYDLGSGREDGLPDDNVEPSTIRHGNYDYVTDSTIWEDNPNHTLPASLYLAEAPSWWDGEIPWPPIGPDVDGMVNLIPAQKRYEAM